MISRRVFLKNGGLALVSLGFAPEFLARTVAAAGSARKRVLITIFQRGAVDGLNMIVPFGEREYYAARPSIALARPSSDPQAALGEALQRANETVHLLAGGQPSSSRTAAEPANATARSSRS